MRRTSLAVTVMCLCLIVPRPAWAQSWTTPWTATTGVLISAAQLNQTRDNLSVLRTGGMAIASQGANEIIYASSATQLARAAALTFNGSAAFALSAGATGAVSVGVRNTTSGAANYGRIQVGNDDSATTGILDAYSTIYTPTADILAGGVRLAAGGAGGLSITASHASGDIRFYAGGTTEVGRIDSTAWFINDTANANNTTGLTINGVAESGDELFSLKHSGSIAHPFTALTETDTVFYMEKVGTVGGVYLKGFTESGTGVPGIIIEGYSGATAYQTTKSTAANGLINLVGYVSNGTTGRSNPGADENLVTINDGATARFIFDADGDSHQDVGTAWTNFDDHDDARVLDSLSYYVSRPSDPTIAGLRRKFGDDMDALVSREAMQRMKLVTFNDDGHHFVNMSKLAMLNTGAIRQQANRIDGVEAEIARLNAQIQALQATIGGPR